MAGVNPWKGADSLILKRLISMVLAGIFFIAAAAGDAAVVDQIHHPENHNNTLYTQNELRTAIESLRAFIQGKAV